MRDKPRLYINQKLEIEMFGNLSKEQAHYLCNVLRLPIGGEFMAFNGFDGEYCAKITEANKKGAIFQCVEKFKEQDEVPNISLFFAPIKGHRNDNIIEKATEIGIKNIQPIITERTIVRKINVEKYQAIAIEAAEQCERLNVPDIQEIKGLFEVLEYTDKGVAILFADELGATELSSAKDIASINLRDKAKIALLIGPEGGFSAKEREKILKYENVTPITLGPRILRADTAVISGLTLIQKFGGDW